MFLMWVAGNLPTRANIEWLKRGGGKLGGEEPLPRVDGTAPPPHQVNPALGTFSGLIYDNATDGDTDRLNLAAFEARSTAGAVDGSGAPSAITRWAYCDGGSTPIICRDQESSPMRHGLPSRRRWIMPDLPRIAADLLTRQRSAASGHRRKVRAEKAQPRTLGRSRPQLTAIVCLLYRAMNGSTTSSTRRFLDGAGLCDRPRHRSLAGFRVALLCAGDAVCGCGGARRGHAPPNLSPGAAALH